MHGLGIHTKIMRKQKKNGRFFFFGRLFGHPRLYRSARALSISSKKETSATIERGAPFFFS